MSAQDSHSLKLTSGSPLATWRRPRVLGVVDRWERICFTLRVRSVRPAHGAGSLEEPVQGPGTRQPRDRGYLTRLKLTDQHETALT